MYVSSIRLLAWFLGLRVVEKVCLLLNLLVKHLNRLFLHLRKLFIAMGNTNQCLQIILKLIFAKGCLTTAEFDGKHRTLLILDDLMTEAGSEVSNIFTKISHHRNISVIFLTQNLFFKSQRTMNLNTQYLVLFKNPRDALQVATLGRQMYPGNSKFLVEAFKMATEKPFGYLLIDLRADTLEKYRLRSNIFSGERQYVYVPK